MKVRYECPCGGTYKHISDEDAEGIPPSFTSRFFYCKLCQTNEWLEPEDFGWDDWPDAES